jgi:hypothetical protein
MKTQVRFFSRSQDSLVWRLSYEWWNRTGELVPTTSEFLIRNHPTIQPYTIRTNETPGLISSTLYAIYSLRRSDTLISSYLRFQKGSESCPAILQQPKPNIPYFSTAAKSRQIASNNSRFTLPFMVISENRFRNILTGVWQMECKVDQISGTCSIEEIMIILVRNPEDKRPLGRSRDRLQHNFKRTIKIMKYSTTMSVY